MHPHFLDLKRQIFALIFKCWRCWALCVLSLVFWGTEFISLGCFRPEFFISMPLPLLPWMWNASTLHTLQRLSVAWHNRLTMVMLSVHMVKRGRPHEVGWQITWLFDNVKVDGSCKCKQTMHNEPEARLWFPYQWIPTHQMYRSSLATIGYPRSSLPLSLLFQFLERQTTVGAQLQSPREPPIFWLCTELMIAESSEEEAVMILVSAQSPRRVWSPKFASRSL